MTTGVYVLIAAVGLALGFGGYRLISDGRFRGTHRIRRPKGPAEPEGMTMDQTPTPWADVVDAVPAARAGDRATLVQFSSAFCAPCRATRRVLDDIAEVVPGVVHLEVDAEHHLDLVRRLSVLRTPTTLILDARGREVSRAAGAPRKEQVLAALPLGDR